MNNDEDFQVCREKHLQRFQLNKVVFYSTAASLSEQWFLFLQTTEFKITKENQSKRIIFHFAENAGKRAGSEEKISQFRSSFPFFPTVLSRGQKVDMSFFET